MFKRIRIFIIFMSIAGVANALPAKKVASPTRRHPISVDSTKVNVRLFNEEAIRKYRDDPAFKYAETKTGITLWDRFWFWVWNAWQNFWLWVAYIFEKLFGGIVKGKHAASIFKFIILGLAAFFIIYVISKIAGIDLFKLFKKKKGIVDITFTESLENIHEINFDEGIENALSIKNYRLAVRLLFLRSLKQLSDSNLINWKAEKTNAAYLNELTDGDQRRYFAMMIRQFEFIWYGDFPVDGQSFQSINDTFQEFKQHIA